MTINERILQNIQLRHTTQKDLAEHLGIGASTLNNWLKLGRSIPAEYIIPICEFLEVTIEYLLSGENKTSEYRIKDKDLSRLLENYNNLTEHAKDKLLGASFQLLQTSIIEEIENA